MLKLKHYFKKFWAPILLCVGLLFLQSQSEYRFGRNSGWWL